MRQLILWVFLLLAATAGFAQGAGNAALIKADSITKENEYHNRKFSFGMSEQWYGYHANSSIYHALDVNFSYRFKNWNLGKIACFEFTTGFSFQPYQGYRLHWGFDYELLVPKKFHLYLGGQYALGLETRTIESDSKSSVVVGNHSYVVPFLGMMYWPFRREIDPTFWNLAYLKGQIGYSSLINTGSVTTTALFPANTATTIRQNISSGLYLSFGIGINLPSFKGVRLFDTRIFQYNLFL